MHERSGKPAALPRPARLRRPPSQVQVGNIHRVGSAHHGGNRVAARTRMGMRREDARRRIFRETKLTQRRVDFRRMQTNLPMARLTDPRDRASEQIRRRSAGLRLLHGDLPDLRAVGDDATAHAGASFHQGDEWRTIRAPTSRRPATSTVVSLSRRHDRPAPSGSELHAW